MLKKAKIEQLSKINLRYRILQMDGESYLVDADRPFLISYFFPWILSFIPHLAYPLTKEEVQTLAPSDLSKVLNKKDTQKKGFASAFGGVQLPCFYRRLFLLKNIFILLHMC